MEVYVANASESSLSNELLWQRAEFHKHLYKSIII